jgi:hypothetical protein
MFTKVKVPFGVNYASAMSCINRESFKYLPAAAATGRAVSDAELVQSLNMYGVNVIVVHSIPSML